MKTNNCSNKEKSLVDILKTLILRKWWFIGFFSLVFVLFVLFAFSRPVEITNKNASHLKYTTYFFVGDKHLGHPLEPLTIIDIKIREIYLNELNQNIPFEIDYDVPKNGNIIRFVTVLPNTGNIEETDSIIQTFHLSVLKPILLEHEKIIQAIKIENERNLENKGSPYATPSKILKLAQRTILQTNALPSTKLKIPPKIFILVGFFTGILAGFVGVVFVEFYSQIRKLLKAENFSSDNL